MVFYHQSRIEHDYIPDLRASFKAYDATQANDGMITSSSTSGSDANLSILRNLLFDRNSDDLSTLEKHGRLIIASYNLRKTRGIEGLLCSSASSTSKSKKLWVNVCLFARLRGAYECFKDITLALPSFKHVSITLIPCPLVPPNSSKCTLSLGQTFSILKLAMDTTTIRAVLGHGWTLDKTKREFTRRQKQKPNIHAEIQMLMFLNALESSRPGRFPYFGCSKLSCFMCNHFLRCYGHITTRGSHGRLFKPWTVPNVDGLQSGQASRTARALISVQKQVEKTLKAAIEGPIKFERTSVIAGSSILDGRPQQQLQRQLHIKRLRMIAERERIAEMFRR